MMNHLQLSIIKTQIWKKCYYWNHNIFTNEGGKNSRGLVYCVTPIIDLLRDEEKFYEICSIKI